MSFLPHFETLVFFVTVGFVGACMGSLINVVIYRFPIMMERAWLRDCLQFLREWLVEQQSLLATKSPTPDNQSQAATAHLDNATEKMADSALIQEHFPLIHDEQRRTTVELIARLEASPQINPPEPFNLAIPRSHCPACGSPIPWFRNIPLFSWLVQKGRAHCCGAVVPSRYFWVELAGAVLCLLAVYHYGFEWRGFLACVFLLILLTLTGIDWEKRLLPDQFTLPLLWLGLVANVFNLFMYLPQAVLGAVLGYGLLWVLFHLHRLLTGREGLGYGDFKLVAAFGAWFGWKSIPVILFVAAVLGLILAAMSARVRERPREQPISFGPPLCAAAALFLFYGHSIVYWLGY